MLPHVVSLNNTPNHSGEDICDISPSSSSSLHHHSVTCLSQSSSRSTWFHGTMSKCEANHILMQSSPGSFLVRQQDPSRFYMSLSTTDGVEHHPVKRVGRQFYYTGETYSSLSDLVELFKQRGGEPVLVNPFQSTISIGCHDDVDSLCVAQTTNVGDLINNEISVCAGDLITLLERPDCESEWLYARNNRTGETGLVDFLSLSPLLDGREDVTTNLFVHRSDISDAVNRLRGRGSFLIRPSSQGRGCWAILVNVGKNQIKKFLIKELDDSSGGWSLAGRRFPSIQHIIDRYCHFPIMDDVKLCHAILADVRTPSDSFSQSVSSDTTPEEEAKDLPTRSGTGKIVASVAALRKSREDKPWKSCYLSLSDDPEGNCQLFVKDDSEASKTKLEFKLSHCILYSLDESAFDQDGCFYLTANDSQNSGIYLCIQPYHIFADWIALLRPRIQALHPGDLPTFNGFQFALPDAPKLAIMRVHIEKFESEALKSDHIYSANLTLNGIRVCNTPLLTPAVGRSVPAVIFDSSFLIPFAPCTNVSVQVAVTVHQRGKTRPFGMSPIMQMPPSEMSKFAFNSGVSLRMSCSRIAVFGDKEYAPVLEWLESCPVEFLEYISDNLSTQDRSLFSLGIVSHLYSRPQKLLDFIQSILSPTLAAASAENALRQDSLVTSIISQTLKTAARTELENKLEERSLSSMKLADAHDIEAIVLCVVALSQTGIVAQLLSLIKIVAEKRFPKEPYLIRRILSTVLILRFVNPTILAKFNGNPVGQAVAKGVQAVANSVCAKVADPDEYSHTTALRGLFDEIDTVQPKFKEDSLQPPQNLDWLAISCHIMYTVICSRPKDTIPSVPDHILRILLAHKPHN